MKSASVAGIILFFISLAGSFESEQIKVTREITNSNGGQNDANPRLEERSFFNPLSSITNFFGFGGDKKQPEVDILMSIKTMALVDADVDSTVHLLFYDTDGVKSALFIPSSTNAVSGFNGQFSRDSNITFRVNDTYQLGDIERIEIWHTHSQSTSKMLTDWKLELVTLVRSRTGDTFQFPVVRTLVPDVHYTFYLYDTFLPADDKLPEQRKRDLKVNRLLYQYHELNSSYNGAPVVKLLPDDQKFPGEYMIKIGASIATETVANQIVKRIKGDKWKSYEQMQDVFLGWLSLSEPWYMKKDFASNNWFARQRLDGIDPVLIKLCTKIPEKFGVTDKIVYNLMDYETLDDAIAAKKLFITDHHLLDKLFENDNENVPAPIGLFYLNRNGILKIIAIQLLQNKGPDNPVFTPKDDHQLWQLVKFYYNTADYAYHESVVHLGYTHLLMETICVCTYRNLAPSHPIFRLLRPHFLSTMAINRLAIELLVNRGGQVDSALAITGKSMLRVAGVALSIYSSYYSDKVIISEFLQNPFYLWTATVERNQLQDYNMTREAIVPDMFEASGMTKENMPDFSFREDYTDIYNVIKLYVTDIVRLYYDTDEDVQGDVELRAWRVELTTPTTHLKGNGLKGVPGDDKNGFNNRKELIDVLTAIISTASARHAAVNFMQYDWYAFPPHHPGYLEGPMPQNKSSLTKDYVISQMPDVNMFLDMTNLVKTLSNRLTNNLGDFEVPMFYDPDAQKIVQTFQKKLEALNKTMYERNEKREYKYGWLLPYRIPNAISI